VALIQPNKNNIAIQQKYLLTKKKKNQEIAKKKEENIIKLEEIEDSDIGKSIVNNSVAIISGNY
jgi:hypothetical protein